MLVKLSVHCFVITDFTSVKLRRRGDFINCPNESKPRRHIEVQQLRNVHANLVSERLLDDRLFQYLLKCKLCVDYLKKAAKIKLSVYGLKYL